jgi:hypothetical protein
MGRNLVVDIEALCKKGETGGALSAERALQDIRRLCVANANTPQGYNLDHAAMGGNIVRPIEAPSVIVRVPTVQIAAVTTGGATSVTFAGIGPCMLIGWNACLIDNAGALVAPHLFQIQAAINNQDRLVTDGEQPAFVNAQLEFANAQFYAPLRRRLAATDRIGFLFVNGSANPATPVVELYVRADRDLLSDDTRVC